MPTATGGRHTPRSHSRGGCGRWCSVDVLGLHKPGVLRQSSRMWLIRSFQRTILFVLTLFGIYFLPSDILSLQDATEPWVKIYNYLNQRTALWIFALLSSSYIAWIDARPLFKKWLWWWQPALPIEISKFKEPVYSKYSGFKCFVSYQKDGVIRNIEEEYPNLTIHDISIRNKSNDKTIFVNFSIKLKETKSKNTFYLHCPNITHSTININAYNRNINSPIEIPPQKNIHGSLMFLFPFSVPIRENAEDPVRSIFLWFLKGICYDIYREHRFSATLEITDLPSGKSISIPVKM